MKVGQTLPIEWLRASLWVKLFMIFVGSNLPAAVIAQAPATDHSATQVLTQLRPSVVKVINISKTSGSDTGNGTGFIAGSESLVVSNYHVVSKVALQPNQFELEYLADDGSRGKLQLVALDVANDLALLRLEKPLSGGRPIKLSARKLQKGDNVLSIGFPLNKGLTIVSGTNNGKAEDSYQGQLHYSGAVNPGMSGGPAVNGDGALVGVNVAYTVDAQLVSLLVAAEKVEQLLGHPLAKDTSTADYWRLEVGRQLRKHAEALALPLTNNRLPSRKFDTYTSVDFEPLGYKCAGVRTDPKGKFEHELDGRVCRSNSGVYVDGETYSGSVDLYTGIRTNRGMSALRFADVRATNFALKEGIED